MFRQLFSCTLLMSTVWTSLPVFARTTDYSPDLLDMSLEQLMQLPITGSTLNDESLTSVPSAVTIFHHEEMSRMGLQYLHELLPFVPGYQQQHSADNAYAFTYSTRGRRNSTEAREILLLMDGRVLSDPHTGSSDGPFPLIPLAQIERVEVIRGPGSALYGSSAFTGVINLISRRGVREAELSVGSLHSTATHVLTTIRPNSWQLDVFANARRDNGQSFNVPVSFSANGDRVDTRDPISNGDIDLMLQHGNTTFRAAHHQANAHDFYSIEAVDNGFNRFKSQLNQASIEHDFRLQPMLNLQAFAGYLQTQHDFNIQATAAGDLAAISNPPSNDPLLLQGVLESEAWDVKLDGERRFDNHNNLRLGVSWRIERDIETKTANNFDLGQLVAGVYPINYYGNFNHDTAIGRPHSRHVLGVYSQYLHNLTPATRLTLGMRFDDYSDTGSRMSPRLALVHQLSDVNTIKLLYGEAFRAPSMNETGLINNPLLIGNPDLQHETVKTCDLIWLGNWLSLSTGVTVFFNQFEQPITTDLVGNTRTFINGISDNSTGLELEAVWQASEQWLLRGTFTHFNSLPMAAFREADTLGSLAVNYETGQWNLNVSGTYQGTRALLAPDGSLKTLNAVWLANMALQFRASAELTMELRVRNLFDRTVSSPPQGNVMPEGVPARGREVMVGVVWTY